MTPIDEAVETENPLFGKFDEMVDALLATPPDAESDDSDAESPNPAPSTPADPSSNPRK